MDRLKSIFDSAIDSHPLAKGAVGGSGGLAAWISDKIHMLDPIAKGIALWGGALVVILSLACWGLDLRRKWKHRNDPYDSEKL